MFKFAVAAFAATMAAAPAGADAAVKYCAHGYHHDKSGYCQPNHPQTNRWCAPGYVRQVSPHGWRCRPPNY
jgi:hypothetical protein